ncbi:MAG: SDR family oxidoreductase [Ignavibacteriaceae bacterium]|nr:SDR family oxidoreductase [Ignavibacteriaceae bacterium]
MKSRDLIKKRILIVGANGLLGQRIIAFYQAQENVELLGCSIEEKPTFENTPYINCDITVREEIKNTIFNFYPDIVINAAAYTNVDLCESERATAWKINVKGVENIVEACRSLDAKIIHFSTDYIFNGNNGPYDENVKPDPVGYYGRTKLASENVLKIGAVTYAVLRTNVLYGIANSRPDYVRWVINSLRSKQQIRIVTDQVGNPTFVEDLVTAVNKVIVSDQYDVYNIAGKEFINRYEFALQIADMFNLDKKLITPIVTEELKQPAKRPLKGGLIITKAINQLGYNPHSIIEALEIIKKQLSL